MYELPNNNRRSARDPLALIEEIGLMIRQGSSNGAAGAHAATQTPLTTAALDFRRQYETGMSLFQLAIKHDMSISTMRTSITSVGGTMRMAGRSKGATSPGYERLAELTPELTAYLLAADDDGIRHSEIAKQVGVTKERVRQICVKAGHPTRRERLARHRGHAALVRMAHSVGRQALARTMNDDAKLAAELWNAGHDMTVLAQRMKKTVGSMSMCVSRWRALWPSKFPYKTER